jgi:hypothetical protein
MIKMGIIGKIFGKADISGSATPRQQISGGNTAPQAGVYQRLESIYGREKIELQMLYEQWVIKESWLLKREALPLLSGINPESDVHSLPEQIQNNLEQLWQHARSCVEQGLLRVTNREQEDKDWRVSPLDVYRWARISRVELPDAFSMLMEFVSKTIKQPEPQKNPANADTPDTGYAGFDQDRERVLGIALALLAAYPDKCRNSRGKVKVDRLVSLITEKGEFWLGDETLDLSTTAIRDLISKWLNTLPASPESSE